MPDHPTIDTESPELDAQIKECKPDIQAYIIALKKELKKYVSRNATLEAQAHSSQITIESQRKKLPQHQDISEITDDDVEDVLIPLAIKLIKNVGGIESFITKYNIDRDNLNSE